MRFNADFTNEFTEITRQKRSVFLVGLVVFSAIMSTVGANDVRGATAESGSSTLTLAKRYEPMLMTEDAGEEARQASRLKLSRLTKGEINEFIAASKTWLGENSGDTTSASKSLRQRAILSLDVIRQSRSFDKAAAVLMLKALNESPGRRTGEKENALDSIVERRLMIFLAAEAGQLSDRRIKSELSFIGDAKNDSVERLGVAGALVDAMGGVEGANGKNEIKPTTAQLEALLKNDDSDIRALAVDWFRISPPEDPSERIRFLTSALHAKPRQVRERAQRACVADRSQAVREVCATPGEKPKSKSAAP